MIGIASGPLLCRPPKILKRSARLIVTGMMKTVFALSVMACLGFFIAIGQEAPPAFERAGDAEEAAAEEHDPFDPALNAPKLVRVQVEYIEMPHKDLTRLMMGEKSVTADATALRIKVLELVEKEEAQVMETQIVVCRSGQKATTESIHEFIYPTEYVPFKDLQNTLGTEKSGVSLPTYVTSPATPSAFETKNLGSTLEAEPTIGADDKLIDLRFLPEFVWHTGNTEWFEHKDERGNITKVIMPGFYKIGTNTSITCISGQYTMVGVHSPKNEKGEVDRDRKIMVFVKCDVLAVIP